jgi:hypothetical protein
MYYTVRGRGRRRRSRRRFVVLDPVAPGKKSTEMAKIHQKLHNVVKSGQNRTK